MKKKLILLSLAAAALILTIKFFPEHCDCGPKEEVSVGGTVISVDVADSPAEREQGLSGREELKEDEGMLFVFEEPFLASFWMKDMSFAIDIIWIDSNKRVVGIEKDISRETYPEIFRPSEAIKYVLEVPAGFSQRHAIDMGSEVFFEL